MIKVVIFDAGGVVCETWLKTTRDYFSRTLGIAKKEYENAFHACDNDSAIGKEPIEKFVRKISDKLRKEIDCKKFIELVLDIKINKGVVKLAEKLKEKYTVAMLSDNCEPSTSKLRNTVKDAFHKFYFSNEMHMRKPQLRIFRYVCKDMNVQPKCCIFIDDKPENVKAAKQVGMHAVQFKNYKKLLKDLKNHGVIL